MSNLTNNHSGYPLSSAPESKGGKTATASRGLDLVFLILWLTACSAAVFSRTFALPYAFDDLDHLHAVAALRSGQVSFSTWFFLNHNEHIVPLLRLYFLLATRISGLDAWALQTMLFVTYVAGAVGCAWMFFSVTRSRLGAFLAGTIYATAGGFAGSVVWEANQFSIAGTVFIFAMAILVSGFARKRWSIAIALALVVVAAMAMGPIVLVALSIPAYLYLARPESIPARRRNMAIAVSLLLIGSILAATRWLMMRQGLAGKSVIWNGVNHAFHFSSKGLCNGLFLILTIPGRFLLAWLPTGELGLRTDLTASLLGWVLLLVSLRWVAKPMRTLLVSLWIGDCLLTLLIGMGRYRDTYSNLFVTDRYYFFSLLPLALQTAAVLQMVVARALDGSRQRRVAVTAILGVVLIMSLASAHSRLDQSLDWDVLNDHKLAIQQAKVLAQIVKDRAGRQKLHLADGPIRFPGVHKDHISLACVVFTQFPEGLPGITWSFSRIAPTNVASVWMNNGDGWGVRPTWDVPPISDADAAVENQILDDWAQIERRKPYSCMVEGRMQDITSPAITNCVQAAHASETTGALSR